MKLFYQQQWISENVILIRIDKPNTVVIGKDNSKPNNDSNKLSTDELTTHERENWCMTYITSTKITSTIRSRYLMKDMFFEI